MNRPIVRRLRRLFLRGDTGIAAVEFALLAPVFVGLAALGLDLGHAYQVKLQIISATSAAAQYAFLNGQSVTSSTAATFLSNVASVVTATAAVTPAPTVTVRFNNATDGSNAANYYCTGSTSPPNWTSTGTSSSSCGGSVMSGKYVTISVTASTTSLFFPGSPSITASDQTIVRVQ